MLFALATAAVSGVSVLVNATAVRQFADATAYTTAKNVVAATVLCAVVCLGAAGGARLTRPTAVRQWLGLLAVGLVGGSVPFVLFFEGLARASSTQAAFLHKTLVLWVAVLAVVLLRERLQWGHWLAIGAILVGQAGLAGVPGAFGGPELLILGATLLWSVEVVVAKRLLHSLTPWTVGLARMGLGSAALLVWLAARGGLGGVVPTTGEQVGWVLVTGLLLATYVGTWLAALARAQAVDVTAVLVLAVPVTAALEAVVGGASLAPEVGWLLLVATGGALAWWLGSRHPSSAVPARG